ncbi:NADP-dependent malic enzyme [Xanthobacter sp. TB0139]|uniref:NADP-dependent malic enzyme n=1 Tax=Xanthobacter sp. TB0139 TaxID=3459178 RepID=UPI00403A17DE
MASNISDDLRSGALYYHRFPRPGKLEIKATKPLGNQRDLALAYSPGVAAACEAIEEDPMQAAELTSRGNLVAVVSNGTAVLGLGNIGPLAGKPVMEGKAVLFKKFAGIDVFDIEIDAPTVDRMVDVISALEPTFGGINLEDIKAPECFEVEKQLRAKMKIPVFHDDQHGTAIIVGAAVRNALEIGNRNIEDVKIVASGAGAAALACLNLLVKLGAKKENIWVCDLKGLIHDGRNASMDPYKAEFAQKKTDLRTLDDVMDGAHIFLGLSAAGVLKPDMVKKMAPNPLILALANPTPEIMPEEAREARPDALICTGRSDYPNQVNNVLCFPYIFRGALDVGATDINSEMKMAAVEAIAALAREAPSDVVARAYGGEARTFGAESLIPSPFDPRLIMRIAPAVAKAAMDTGVASRPIEDFDAYMGKLDDFMFRSSFIMRPLFARAKQDKKRVIYAEGEDERVLRAVQAVVEEGIAQPMLVARPSVVEARIKRFGLSIQPGRDFELINPEDDPRYRDYVRDYVEAAGRRGITPDAARTLVRTNPTVIAALALRRGEADAMLCGIEGRFTRHLRHVRDIIGRAPGVKRLAALSLLITQKGNFFICDTQIQSEPSPEELAAMTIQAATHVRRLGLEPRVALLSHSNFGSHETASTIRMREALSIVRHRAPDLEVDGEMQADAALVEEIRKRALPDSRLTGVANVLVMPDLDAADIAYNMLKVLGDALPVGPILMGTAKPVHILSPTTTARGVANMTAVAVVEAQTAEK